LLKALSNLTLNTSNDGVPTTSLGNNSLGVPASWPGEPLSHSPGSSPAVHWLCPAPAWLPAAAPSNWASGLLGYVSSSSKGKGLPAEAQSHEKIYTQTSSGIGVIGLITPSHQRNWPLLPLS